MLKQQRWFASVLVAGAWAVVPARASDGRPVAPQSHYVRVPAGSADDLARLGLHPSAAIDYGSFVWLELGPDDLARLKSSNVAHREEINPFTLRLGEQSFDPLWEPPVLPPGLDAVPTAGPDLHLVQMIGPTKGEWLEALRADGLEIVQYIHPHTYVVWGETNAQAGAAERDYVRWTGPFAPAYRLLPKHRNLPDQQDKVRVLMVRGADTAAIIRRIEQMGGLLTGARKLNAVFELAGFDLSTAKLADVANIPGVYSVQVVPKDGGLRGEMSDQVNVNNVDPTNLAFPGYLLWLSGVGLNGNGVVIANVDGGIQNSHPDLVSRLVGCTGTTCGGGASSSHGTHTAGIMAADGSSGTLDGYGFLRGLGVAPGANLVEQVYSPYYTWPDGMLLLMTDSYNNGASLSGNSWGPSGSPQGYDNDTMQVDIGVRDADPNAPGNQPLTFVLSFMNGYGGTSTQGTPDEAKNIFNIGSTKMQTAGGAQILEINDLSSNTAHGPALDGRTIPHMVAPGCYVDSTVTGSSYGTMCGTSMASPHVSGAVALFIEYYRGLPSSPGDPSPAMIKAAFLPVAHDLAGNLDADGNVLGHPFDSKQGWGRMDLEAVVDPQVTVDYYDNPVVFDNTGEEWSEAVAADDPGRPLHIMLVWTDAPGHGLGGSTPAWNNNLDLIVESGVDTYRGNNFGPDGWSRTGGTADIKNNTEGVFIGPTAPDSYTIRVVASSINSDAIPGVGDTTDQDFALVCYNCGPAGPRPPTAQSGQASTAVDVPVTITLAASDDGLPDPPAVLTYIITSLPTYELQDAGNSYIIQPGDLPYTLVSGGNQVVYAPSGGYAGPDSFQFKANDGGTPPDGGDSNIATVSITVGGPDWDPVANDVSSSTPLSTPTDVTLSGSDPNGDPLTYVVESLPAQGSLTDPGAGAINTVPYTLVAGGNVVTYTPPPDQYLQATFDFSVRDATAGSNVATVTVTVGGPGWDPVANDVSSSTPLSTPTDVTLSGTDPNGDPLTYVIESLPAEGGLSDPGAGTIDTVPYTLVGSGNVVTYAPPPDQYLQATFDFSVRDATAGSNLATVTVTVGGPEWDPVAYDVDWPTGVNIATDIPLSASDPNGDPLSYVIESLPAQGSLSDPGAGTIDTVPYTLAGGGNVVHYQPPWGQNLAETFDFSAQDATAGSNVATVTVTVGVAQMVYAAPLDTDPGWSTEGDWAFGTPTGAGGPYGADPSSGYTGANVYGYNLDGYYSNNMPVYYLTTTAFDCTRLSGTELRFRRWLGIESGWFDEASIEVSTNGASWTTVWEHSDGDLPISESSWSQQSYDLSAVADGQPAVWIRWGMGPTDGSVTYPGWNLDDVEVWGLVSFVPGDTDGDGDVDLDDFAGFADCLAGPDVLPAPPAPLTVEQCLGVFDFDADSDVDVGDFGSFQAAFTG